jgi:hypothetical protein
LRNLKCSIWIGLISLMCASCVATKEKRFNKCYELDESTTVPKYDTINGVFLREVIMYPYGSNVALQGGYFVNYKNDFDKSAYDGGVYLCDYGMLDRLQGSNAMIHFDSMSIANLTHSINDSLRQSWYDESKLLNPHCGLYYKKVELHAEVLCLGKCYHKIPAFGRCDDRNKKDGKTVEKYTATHFFTRIFSINYK